MTNRLPVRFDSFDRVIQRMLKDCDEIVLFGSQSLRQGRRDSDWDVLCVGDIPPYPIKSGSRRVRWHSHMFSLDLVWTSRSELRSSNWLGSELAGHVAKYGSWLRGEGDWRTRTKVSSHAILAKRRRVEVRIDFQRAYASGLLEPYLVKHVTLLRRDIQRLSYLQNGLPVPVTPYLDSEWREHLDRDAICRVANSLGCDLEKAVFGNLEDTVSNYRKG